MVKPGGKGYAWEGRAEKKKKKTEEGGGYASLRPGGKGKISPVPKKTPYKKRGQESSGGGRVLSQGKGNEQRERQLGRGEISKVEGTSGKWH